MADEERVQYKFMIPVSLKDRIEEAAHKNRRSVSGEIIATLEEYYPTPFDEETRAATAEFVKALQKFMDRPNLSEEDEEKVRRGFDLITSLSAAMEHAGSRSEQQQIARSMLIFTDSILLALGVDPNATPTRKIDLDD